MFDNLSEKLQRVFKNLRGEGKLRAEKHGIGPARDPHRAAAFRPLIGITAFTD
jgi:hypothetical protein